MKNIIKKIIRRAISFLSPSEYERLLACSILANSFLEIKNALHFDTRENLWDYAIICASKIHPVINYLEYGVHEGYSIRYFSNQITNPNSLFFGLDSFEGLPESWGALPAGFFSTNNCVPSIDDSRITFIKGWFQDTSTTVLGMISDKKNFIVHFDADLYSSTLYALAMVDNLKQPYFAIFDEFPGHEARALYNYLQSFGAKAEFIGRTLDINKNPGQVLCRISPNI